MARLVGDVKCGMIAHPIPDSDFQQGKGRKRIFAARDRIATRGGLRQIHAAFPNPASVAHATRRDAWNRFTQQSA
jgi:hypothetical protein